MEVDFAAQKVISMCQFISIEGPYHVKVIWLCSVKQLSGVMPGYS